MPQKKSKPAENVAKLRQVDVLMSHGSSVAEAVRAVFTHSRWRKDRGGRKNADQSLSFGD